MFNPFSHQNLTIVILSYCFSFKDDFWLFRIKLTEFSTICFLALKMYVEWSFTTSVHLIYLFLFSPNKTVHVLIIWNLKTFKKKKTWGKNFIPVVVSSFFTSISIWGNCLFCKLRKCIRFGNQKVNLSMVYEFCFSKICGISLWWFSLNITFWCQI